VSGEAIFGIVILGGLVGWVVLFLAAVYREFFGWSHINTCFGEEPFEINGLDVWRHEWIEKGRWAKVRDPLYGAPFKADVYEITDGKSRALFAVCEFSNNVWGFYRKRRELPKISAPERSIRY
jgi:hypothetical protein